AAPSPAIAIEALEARVAELEGVARLVTELQARLRDAHEHLAAGEAKLVRHEAMILQLNQAISNLNSRSESEGNVVEELRGVVGEQAMRLANVGRALLT